MEQQIFDYGFWALLVWTILREFIFPNLTNTLKILLPSKVKERQEEIKHHNEVEEKQFDLQERQVVAFEQIGKSQVLIEERLRLIHDQQLIITSGQMQTNSALAIVLDRMDRRREDYSPPKEINDKESDCG